MTIHLIVTSIQNFTTDCQSYESPKLQIDENEYFEMLFLFLLTICP